MYISSQQLCCYMHKEFLVVKQKNEDDMIVCRVGVGHRTELSIGFVICNKEMSDTVRWRRGKNIQLPVVYWKLIKCSGGHLLGSGVLINVQFTCKNVRMNLWLHFAIKAADLVMCDCSTK